jgi:beta-lactamase regulating signal transducer with metallopeptidase domain
MIKVSIVILCGLTASLLLRNRSAALRHSVLAAAIACASAMPLVEPFVPSWPVPLHPSLFGRTVEPLALLVPVHGTQPLEDLQRPAPRASGFARRLTAERILAGVWLAGTLGALFMLIIGLARLAGVAARSHEVTGGPWAEMMARLSGAYGIRRPVILLQSTHPTLLATWGVRRPKVILPRSARDWPEERVWIVLGHELAHIRRGDWLTHMTAEFLRSVYWFDPLIWIACWRLRLESEQACDDAVLGLGVEGPDYATHLLDLARTFKQSRAIMFPAPALVGQSSLERRVRAMLNTRVNRTPITRAAGLAIAAVVTALTIPLAGLAASTQATSASFSGALVDAVGRSLPDTTLILTNVQTKEKREVKSDATAHFTFTGLPAGDYSLEAKRLGFATSQGRVTLEAGQNLVRDVALQVGGLLETVRIVGSNTTGSPAPSAAKPRPASTPSQPGIDSCTSSSVGGEIIPPVKLTNDRPVYPPKQQAAGVGARVEIDARIGTDGLMKDFRLTTPADQDFVNAVLDALRQWRFSQTRLDCVPVEVAMHVSAIFAVE